MLLSLLLARVFAGAATIDVFDNSINAGESVTWTSGNVYILKEKVFIEEGARLKIEPGVVIKAEGHSGVNAVALIVTRGAKIFAEGTADEPIIFTSIADDMLPFDESILPVATTGGLWGGVVILGRARTNLPDGGIGNIEGITAGDDRGRYGGSDDGDNSGVIRYVSIRFGGMEISTDNELNGLTFGAVGAGTTVEYVEVFQNRDDGFEWFGGCVNTRYLLATNCMDDAFDYDVGFRGRGQYWCAIHGNAPDGTAGEHDGGGGLPHATPVIANATYLRPRGQLGDAGQPAVNMRQGAGGTYANSIFMAPGTLTLNGNPELTFLHKNLFWTSVGIEDWEQITATSHAHMLEDLGNQLVDPEFPGEPDRNLMAYTRKSLDLRPTAKAALPDKDDIHILETSDTSGYLEQVCFKGAFDPSKPMWTTGWTATDFYGLFSDAEAPVDNVSEECIPVSAKDHGFRRAKRLGTIAFEVKEKSPVGVKVFGVSGRLLYASNEGLLEPGQYSLRDLRIPDYDGVVLVRIMVGKSMHTRRFLPHR